jgi:GNAT superfamily N-acetyltransferase
MINTMGDRSAIAQGLVGAGKRPNPITQSHTLGETNARLYLMAHRGPSGAPVVVGLLKVGQKQLFHWDANGRMHELPNQTCVLDFYVHEDFQRGGFGKLIFGAMLQNERVTPDRLAYDVREPAPVPPGGTHLDWLSRAACMPLPYCRHPSPRPASSRDSLTPPSPPPHAAAVTKAHWLHAEALWANRLCAAAE